MVPGVLLYDVGIAVVVPVVGISVADILILLTVNDATLSIVAGRAMG